MLTTGLVSLNVHEALTFDGTEIVLHPDLFASDGLSTVNSIGTTTSRHPSNIRPASSTGVSSSGSTAIPGVGSSSIGQVATEASKDGSQPVTAAASSLQPSQQQQGAPILTTTPSSETGKLTWGTGGASIMSQRRLEVGDMIEIRVWDPTPMRDRHQSPGGVSSVFRKRGGASVQSNQSSGSVSTEAQKSNTTASKKGSNHSTPSTLTSNQIPAIPPRNTLDSVTSNLSRKMSTTTYSLSANSMQYSEFSGSDQVHPISSKSMALTASAETENVSTIEEMVMHDGTSNSKNDEMSAMASINTEVETNNEEGTTKPLLTPPSNSGKIFTMPATLGGKPPVSSRGRSNTSDIPRLSIVNALPKPPLQPRASTHGDRASTHGDMNFAAYEARKRSSKPIHTREISDMTTDSMVHGLLQNFPPHHPLQNNNNQQQHSTSGNNHADFDVLGVDFLDERGGQHGHVGGGDDDDTEADDVLSIIGKSHHMRFSFVMLVTEKTLTSLKGSARTQVSMLRQVADLYKLSSYDMVSINRIEKNDESAVLEAVSADFVLFSMKDQFISRGDMHAFQKALVGTWVYEGQRLTEVARVSTLYLLLRCFLRLCWYRSSCCVLFNFLYLRVSKRIPGSFGMETNLRNQGL